MNVNFGKAKGVVLGLIVLIIIGVMVGSAVSIVDAGFRGVLLHWNAVDLVDPPLEEGLHFIVPFQDSVVPLEVRTLKYTKATTSASQDLQTVSTEITVNYHPDPTRVNYLYKEVGLDYENRIIQPTVEEVVKQVTANYNAEELITKRPLVKQDIQNEISERLADFNITTEIVSITDFQFSVLFAQAIESKVEAEQKAQKAENDLIRIEVEARQLEAQAVGLAAANVAEANAVSMVFVNTNLAAAGGVMGALILSKLMFGKSDLTMALNGAIGGLVSITAEPLAPTPGLALTIGAIGGLIVVMSIVMLDKMKIDDPVGAISAHGTCGIWGLLAVTLTGGSLGAQVYGALMIFLWTFITSYIFWSLIKMFFGLRVTEEEESDGVDISECGLEAYPEFSKSAGVKPSVYPEQ